MTNVVDLWPRMRDAMPPRAVNPRPHPPAIPVATYTKAAVHEDVPVTLLMGALVRSGLTVSSIDGHGLVIHRIGQDPYLPAPGGVLR